MTTRPIDHTLQRRITRHEVDRRDPRELAKWAEAQAAAVRERGADHARGCPVQRWLLMRLCGAPKKAMKMLRPICTCTRDPRDTSPPGAGEGTRT
jgi:hypothetical protein